MIRIALAAALLALGACAHNPDQKAEDRRMEPTMADDSRAEKAREEQCGARTGMGPGADQASCATAGSLSNINRTTSQTLNGLSGSAPGGVLGGR